MLSNLPTWKMADHLEELLSFLTLDTRVDVKSSALEYILGLTGSDEGKELIRANKEILKRLLDLSTDKHPAVSKDAHLTLLNLSGVEGLANLMVELDVIPRYLEMLLDSKCINVDQICMILSNLTRFERGTESFIKTVSPVQTQSVSNDTTGNPSLYELVDLFHRKDYNPNGTFHYLATLFSNITQNSLARQLFLDRSKCILPRLLPYTQFEDSVVRRGGVVGLLRNLSFEVGSHRWLLSDEVDLLPSLLLPLAGPEQFDEDEMEKLPDDLQYLPDDKTREPDPDIRKMLIEAIMKFCSTKFGRECLREKQTYLIMRELHKWEKDPEVKKACEDLVSILISDEPEAGMENLHEVEVDQSPLNELEIGGKERTSGGSKSQN